jgi:hypothetical protein
MLRDQEKRSILFEPAQNMGEHLSPPEDPDDIIRRFDLLRRRPE